MENLNLVLFIDHIINNNIVHFSRIIDNVRGELQKRQWIIFDGDVDPEWVENLNSVLDDSKLLTLPNGERLAIPPNVSLISVTQIHIYSKKCSAMQHLCFNMCNELSELYLMNLNRSIHQYVTENILMFILLDLSFAM